MLMRHPKTSVQQHMRGQKNDTRYYIDYINCQQPTICKASNSIHTNTNKIYAIMHLSEDLLMNIYIIGSLFLPIATSTTQQVSGFPFPKSNQSVQKCYASCCDLLAMLEIWFGLVWVRAAGCRIQQNRILTVFCPATCRLKAQPYESPTMGLYISYVFHFILNFLGTNSVKFQKKNPQSLDFDLL